MRPTLVVLALMSLACAGGGSGKDDEEEDRTIFEDKDHDDDGYLYDEDCNDEVASINPGAAEICDPGDVDENCNGLADEADPGVTGGITAYPDRDGDGFGDGSAPTPVCAVGGGYVTDATDCDDTDPAVNPAAVEVCDEADVDEDCDGAADDADPNDDAGGKIESWYDEDGDGYGVEAELRCDLGGGWVDQGDDCDDADPSVNPGASEWCDGIDNDCDGATDPDTALNAEDWYRDADRDGYGDPDDERLACTAPSGYVATGDDCDDAEASAHPGGSEVCDDADNDCDGTVDVDASDAPTWYRDADSDGYGAASDTRVQCDAPTGYTSNDDDCNDASAAISPGDPEACDAADTDEDCDGLADDADSAATGKSTFYRDADGDGYGLTSSTTSKCDLPSGYVATPGDCDDGNAAESPGATEVCDASNTDEDCDGRADDADTSVSSATKSSFYADTDGDGYGAGAAVAYCDAPASYVATNDDCSPTNAAIHPGATEVCGGGDDDCDGLVDDADSSLDADEWYPDADGDGYGADGGAVVEACTRPSGYAAAGDCDDAEAGVRPGATEVCFDGVDDDCDGVDTCVGATGADAALRLTGTGAYDWTNFGVNVEIVGDVDGDGVLDLAVADIYGNEWYGTVDVFSGAATGELTPADRLLTASATNQNSEFGSAMEAVADVTGDGLPELWVGAYRHDHGSSYDVGAAYLLDGADLSRIAVLRGGLTSDWFGTDFLELGDVDGDGVDEVLLGGNLSDGPGYKGIAYVVDATVSGEAVVDDVAETRLYASSSSMIVGGNTCRFGDVDGDGADEIGLSGFSSSNQRTVIVSDIPAGDVDISAEPYLWSAGYTVDCAGGDVDDDGYADVVIFHHTGLTYTASLVLGPISTTGATTVATAEDASFRPTYEYYASQLDVADLDGDGRAEWVIGSTHAIAWGDYMGYGTGLLLGFGGHSRGTLTSDDAVFSVGGGRYADYLGASYALGDLEGDGDPEILVGGIGAALLFRYSEL